MIGSGVTGVEFVHMFSSFGVEGDARRQPPAGAARQGPRGGGGARGRLPRARRASCSRGRGRRPSTATATRSWSRCDDGRVARIAATPCWRSARCPTPTASASSRPASRSTPAATSRSTTTASRTCRHIYAAGDVSGKLPLSSVASMQGRKVAEHVMGLHTGRAPPPRLRQGGLGHLHRAGDRRRRPGRGRGVRRRAARSGSRRCRSRPPPRR